MTAKEWLMRGRLIEEEIASLEDVKAKALSRMTSGVSRTDKVSVRSTKDPHAAPDHYAELGRKIDAYIKELAGVNVEIIQAIQKVSDRRYRVILEGYYLQGKNLVQIADSIPYNREYVRQLHGEALKEIKKFIPAE